MIGSFHDLRGRPGAVVEAWRSFWFRSEPAYTLGLIRIAFGALVVAWALSLRPDLHELFGEDGVVPHQPSRSYRWGIFEVWSSDQALMIGWIILLLSSIALAAGWHARLAAVLVFVLVISFQRRDPFVFNSGDYLLRIEALFLALSSCGAALSLDQRRRTGSFWSAQCRSVWLVRLMQVQLSLIYLASVRAKMESTAWSNGTAVSYTLRVDDLQVLPTPEWLSTNAMLMNLVTWGTIALELAIGIFVWNRRLRPWLLLAGVVMHTMIMTTVSVAFFSFAMFVLYMAFVPWETVERLPHSVRLLAMSCISVLRTGRAKQMPLEDLPEAAKKQLNHSAATSPAPPENAADGRTGPGEDGEPTAVDPHHLPQNRVEAIHSSSGSERWVGATQSPPAKAAPSSRRAPKSRRRGRAR
ncbi:HTTM domain-containing protein [Mycobacterium sp. ITM-2016-00318]|uniref:HTTM domain-containing protein n=1 Tax=Mycobacterium sp. ITM-2016-00318 TaxID=2099693 RepID=UPI000CF8A0E3|nr:HTTM domain-containing protein [Mycobacterium sp. ITM-2016-00318]WNG92374.1 HTTM domain-containing protein [Mycobacterium sp. ITM-2016-00318]